MLRFLHTADWQIGRAFNMVEGDAAALLRQARIDVIDRIGALAVAEDAAFVVVAGDVFDAEGLTNTALRAPLARMARFPQVDWYLLPGNHDPDRREGIWDRLESLDLPANVRPVRRAAPVDVGGNAWLLPCPLLTRTQWLSSIWLSCGTLLGLLANGLLMQPSPEPSRGPCFAVVGHAGRCPCPRDTAAGRLIATHSDEQAWHDGPA